MNFIADLHIHSHYSLATSKQLSPEYLSDYAKIKGINVVGTGDLTHPGWLSELREKLQPNENGLLKLKNEFRISDEHKIPNTVEPYFILTGEISSIYKKNGKTRKVHNIIILPDFTSVDRFQVSLQKRKANIFSDGRPIVGIDSKDLLEICLEISDRSLFIPAHIWTPWFSVLGSKSGFDSIKECFEELTGYIYAVETGLSSDPRLNRLCAMLDCFNLVSNSDAHNPESLGRNATIFSCGLNYDSIITTIKTPPEKSRIKTINFFPEEGKYHYDGHRKCGVCWAPVVTRQHSGKCPICGKNVTIGVLNRILEIAAGQSKSKNYETEYYSVVPLKEILAEILAAGTKSKKVDRRYKDLLKANGTEFDILLNLPETSINDCGIEKLKEAIKNMRNGKVHIKHGFDGEYGKIETI